MHQRVGRQAAAVVAHLDLDLVARLARRDRDGRGDVLARGDAAVERLDPMVDRVADDMDQRIADILHHLAVEFDLAAARREANLLAEILREVADDARQRREQFVDALHPHLADRLAHPGDRVGKAVERRDQRRVGARFAEHPGEFVAREDDVGDPGHDAVEQG